jgi:hypothetical protein
MAGKDSVNGFLQTLLGYKKAQAKTPIFPTVLIHVVAWSILFLLPVLLYPVRISDKLFIKSELIDKSVLVVIFYLNYYLLIPLYFERKRYFTYAGLVLLAFIIYLAQNIAVKTNYLTFRSRPPFQMMRGESGDSAFSGIQIYRDPGDEDYPTVYDMSPEDTPFHREFGPRNRIVHLRDRLAGSLRRGEPEAGAHHIRVGQINSGYTAVYPLPAEDSGLRDPRLLVRNDNDPTQQTHSTNARGMTVATPALVPIIDSIGYGIPALSGPRILFASRGNTMFGVPMPLIFRSLSNAISSFTLLLVIGGFIRLAYSYVRNQNEKKTLENANLNAEVNFLKSQINPHFLFNTLNSIYSQAHNRSEHTEYSILKLSELLRYMLYESGEEKVLLEKDIQYLTNYIALQRLRLSSKVTINYTVAGSLDAHVIAPLLLISFIENAFKHGISYSHSSVINIHLQVFEETLTLEVTNPVIKFDTFTPGGLGLKNVTRRLDLLYPGKYWLNTSQENNLYIVNLKINLTND